MYIKLHYITDTPILYVYIISYYINYINQQNNIHIRDNMFIYICLSVSYLSA